jgi:tetratricopeptide (TPR) repeat protein
MWSRLPEQTQRRSVREMVRWNNRWPILLGSVATFLLLAWLFPYVASAYYVAKAGQELKQATITGEARDPSGLNGAVTHLQTALKWHEHNAQAQRLLSEAHLLQGNITRATEVMSQYTALMPKNPQGWWDLAQMYETMGMSELAVAAWRAGGFTAQDLINAGEVRRKSQDYTEASEWYNQAKLLERDSGDPWYYLGLLYEDQKMWQQAIDAYQKATASVRFDQIGQSDPFYRIGIIYQSRMQPLQPESALAAYDSALAANDFGSVVVAADCHYKRGYVLSWLGVDPRQSLLEYRAALKLYPLHHWAHLRLGEVLYQAYGDAVSAEAEAKEAVALWPDDNYKKWPYRLLGDISRDTGLIDAAISYYQEVLRLDPKDVEVQEILTSLLTTENAP